MPVAAAPKADAKPKPVFQAIPGEDGDGAPIYSVLVKRTYDIDPGLPLRRAEKDRPLALIDVYYDHGDAETSTVMEESEIIACKPMTDVVFIGKAYAPDGKAVQSMDAGLQVDGAGRKLIRVIGDRKCGHRVGYAPTVSEPRPFTSMPVRYDLAYGGRDLHSFPDTPAWYPRNHRGKGYAVRNIKAVVQNLALPNIEDPLDLLTPERIVTEEPEGWRLAPLPQGLGWYQKTWYPRTFFCGVLPPYLAPGSLTKEEHMGLLPKDHVALWLKRKIPAFQQRFHCGASLGLSFPHLKGGETVRLRGLTPDGLLHFTLPAAPPSISLDIGLPPHPMDPVMHSVAIRGEDRQVDIVWRASRPYPGMDWLPEMKTLKVEVA